MNELLKNIVLILPMMVAGIIHAIVIKYNLLPSLKVSLDFKKTLFGKPIFGNHKTFRGLFIPIIICALVALALYPLLPRSAFPDQFAFLVDRRSALGFGLLSGLGYVLGELPNSFLKRQLAVAPGKRPNGLLRAFFYLFDQFDSAIGASVLVYLVLHQPWSVLWPLLVLGGIVHIIFDAIAYSVRVKH